MTIGENISLVRQRIADAAQRSGRRGEDITLIAVSKTHPIEDVREAAACGLTDFGENRPQELRDKMAQGLPVRWHQIGQLQTNKIKYVAGRTALIQSVDSFSLMDSLEAWLQAHGLEQDILLQVNGGREPQKSGFLPEEVDAALQQAQEKAHIRVKGLMVVAPILATEVQRLQLFEQMRTLYDRVRTPQMDVLSMGMSEDYEQAILAGSTMVRVGRALFGARCNK